MPDCQGLTLPLRPTLPVPVVPSVWLLPVASLPLVALVDGVVGFVVGVVAAVEGTVGAVVGWVVACVGAVVGAEVSVPTLGRHPQNNTAAKTRLSAQIANFFIVIPPQIRITELVLPRMRDLDRKNVPDFRQN